MKDRIAIVAGIRTPMCKAGGVFNHVTADELGAIAVREVIMCSELPVDLISEVIMGNVAQPANATNVARVIALKAGVPMHVPAFTVQRNCASGAEAIMLAADRITNGQSDIVIAGGAESMSNMPLLHNKQMADWLGHLQRCKSFGEKLSHLKSLRLKHLKPVIGLVAGLTDPICGLIMGKTAEILAREFHITREEQDDYALLSQQRACKAIQAGHFLKEILPVPVPPSFHTVQHTDDGPRFEQSIEQLQKLRPYFDRHNGTVTVGNASQLTDGACAVMLMKESRAKELGVKPLGFVRAAAAAAFLLLGTAAALSPLAWPPA